MNQLQKSLCITLGTVFLGAPSYAAWGQTTTSGTVPKPRHQLSSKSSIQTNESSKEDPETVQREILSELRQIRALLETPQTQPQTPTAAAQPVAPPPVEKTSVSTVGFELGSKNAPVTIVEFADYQCPFCRLFHTTVFNRLKKDYIDTGKVRFVSRDLPLDFHPNALSAAHAARCAGEQGNYWQMRDSLIQHADQLSAENYAKFAGELGLDLSRFNACVDKFPYTSNINQDLADATAAGISGTPAFIIGPSGENSVFGEKVVGAQPYEMFEKILVSLNVK
jgi:protein-disulfide isomerase